MSVAESDRIDSEAVEPRKSPDLPVKPDDPTSPREIENAGDPGPAVLVPPEQTDPREHPKVPPQDNPPQGI